MPGLVNDSVVDDHDQAITEALEQFCNSPEQTYEQFLSTFTHLTPGEDPGLTAPRGHEDPSQREMDSSRERQREDEVTEMEESVYRRMGQANRCSPTADQEEVKCQRYTHSLVKEEKVCNEFCCVLSGTCTLPGEIEEDLIAVSSSLLCHHTLLEISSTFTDQRTHTPSDESEEVVPFHLDENFDYDNVVLSSKYTIQEQNGRPS
uniref:Im:7145024 n=1 Tax=Sinocyclocheilus grahami TaxID=75366 RepID=A0A672PTW7_SINGR